MKCKLCNRDVPVNKNNGDYLNCIQIPFWPKEYKKFQDWMRVTIRLPKEYPLCELHRYSTIIYCLLDLILKENVK